MRKRTSEYALIFGIGGFLSSIILLGVPMAVAAIVLGFIAKRQIENSNGTFSGTGMATAGIILGALGIVTLLVVLIVLRNGF